MRTFIATALAASVTAIS